MQRSILFFIAFFFTTTLAAQSLQQISFLQYTVNEGLSANHIKYIAEDANGFMWMAGFNTVQWFDGLVFHIVQQGFGIHELPDVNNVKVYALPDKKILCVYNTGFSVYQPQTHVFIHYTSTNQNKTIHFLKASDNNIWLLIDGEVVEYDLITQKRKKSFSIKTSIKTNFSVSISIYEDKIIIKDVTGVECIIDTKLMKELPHEQPVVINSFAAVHFLKNKTYLVFGKDGISEHDAETATAIQFQKYPNNTTAEQNSNIQYSKLSADQLCISVGKHIFIYSITEKKITKELVTQQEKALLQSGYFENVFVDSHHNIWASTNTQGVLKINYSPNFFKYYSGLPNIDFSICVAASKLDNKVVSGSYGQGVFVYDTNAKLLKHIPCIDKTNNTLTTVTSVKRISDNEYILLTYGATCFYKLNTKSFSVTPLNFICDKINENNKSLSFGYYQKITEGTNNTFYLKLNRKGFVNFKVEGNTVIANTISVENFTPLLQNEKTIVGATSQQQLAFYSDEKVKTVSSFPSNISINAIAIDNQNNYWIATSKGLFKVAENGNLLAKFSEQNGLANNNIFAVIADVNNNIWCSHYKGISKITTGGSITNLSTKDGLQNSEFNTNAVCKTPDDELFFGGVNGINSFYPNQLLAINEMPKIKIVQIKAANYFTNDTAFWNIKKITLNHPNNTFQLVFNAIGKQQPTTYNYQYRLRNADSSWTNRQQNNNLFFTLEPGVYYLDLYAGKSFNEKAAALSTLQIVVQPPFYNTWWFLLLVFIACVATIGYAILFFVKRKNRKQIIEMQLQQQLEEERHRISRDLHDNMGAYTSALLSNVQQLKTKASETQLVELNNMQSNATQILNSLRDTIWILNNKSISVNDFSDGFKNYCSKLLQNFNNIIFEVEENISNNKTITAPQAIHLHKILQEGFQNIIKHANATKIQYSIQSNEQISICVKDNGNGFDATSINKGNGLENMQWRATQAGYQLQVSSKKNEGTIITLTEK